VLYILYMKGKVRTNRKTSGHVVQNLLKSTESERRQTKLCCVCSFPNGPRPTVKCRHSREDESEHRMSKLQILRISLLMLYEWLWFETYVKVAKRAANAVFQQAKFVQVKGLCSFAQIFEIFKLKKLQLSASCKKK
jgi:hypothetical protein